MTTTILRTGGSLCTLLILSACGSSHTAEDLNQLPAYLGAITRLDVDGMTRLLLKLEGMQRVARGEWDPVEEG